MQTLKDRPEYIGTLPTELSGQKVVIIDELHSGTVKIKGHADIIIVALLNKGWEELKKIKFDFEDQDAKLQFIALIIGSNSDSFELETISNHHVPHTNATYYIRSAMFDRSRIDFRGNIIIEKGAHQTDSYLAHHSLMLSPNAKTDTEPCLEIEADDVAAGHAATVGRVDEHLLFYLQSRGLDRHQAQDVLIKGFLESDLDRIPNHQLQEILAESIACLMPTSPSSTA